MSIRERITAHLDGQPLLQELWQALRGVGALRAISVDVTRRCNLRCTGCYFFSESMDAHGEADKTHFLAFVEDERHRGTNFVTVLGSEPSLALDRLRTLAQAFRLMVVTNGLKPIPREGLEHVAIGVSVWGDRHTDRKLRGWNRIDVLNRALAHYVTDTRVTWYITLPASPGSDTESLVHELVCTGQFVGFNYYGDLKGIGGIFDHRRGFEAANEFVSAMLERYPKSIVFTRYLNKVITEGRLLGRRWGHAVCASISVNHPANALRLRNGEPYSPHFRAYNPDLLTTRRCCVGETRDCATCFDVWAHMSWVLLSLERHLDMAADFRRWLVTAYLFHGAARLVDPTRFRVLLPQLNALERTIN
jgi:hypothetical protein